jgi:carboxymethylenebutenolidase
METRDGSISGVGELDRRTFLKVGGGLIVAAGCMGIPDLGFTQGGAAVAEENVKFPGQAGTVGGFLAKPAGRGPFPGMIVIHENRGVTDYIKDVTRELARAGYASLAVNLVSRSLGPDYPGGSDEALKALGQLSDAAAMADLDAGMDYLKKQPVVFTNSIGCMGFCMGGRYSLLFAGHRRDLGAAVVFYGRTNNKITELQSLSPIDRVPEIAAPILCSYGAADAGIPVADAEALEAALKKQGKTYDFKIYPGAKHAFHREGPNYQAEAAKDSWQRSVAWLDRHLKSRLPKG